FFDNGALPKLRQRLSLENWNGVFQLQPPQLHGARLNSQSRRCAVHNSNPDRGPPVGPQVGLPDRPLARDRCAPAAAANQEFSLDLKAHGARGEAAARNGNFDYDIHATLEPKCKAGGMGLSYDLAGCESEASASLAKAMISPTARRKWHPSWL